MRISEILHGITNEDYGANDDGGDGWPRIDPRSDAAIADERRQFGMATPEEIAHRRAVAAGGGDPARHPMLPKMYIDWSRDENTGDTVQRWPNAMFATDQERDAPNPDSYPEMLISPQEHMPDPRFRPGGVANDNRRLGRRRGG